MTSNHPARAGGKAMRLAFAAAATISALAALNALAQTAAQAVDAPLSVRTHGPACVFAGETERSTLYADGSQRLIQIEHPWHLMCGSNPAGVTDADVQRWAEHHYAAMASGDVRVVDTGGLRTGLNIIYNVDGSVPAEALNGLALAEAYLENLFNDPITVTINITFQAMSGSVIGSTSSSVVANVSYTNSRNGLVNGMDSDDVIQSWLPTTSYCPVRYNGNSSTVTNETAVDWTRANYRATVGTTTGADASMSYNTNFVFDFDPSDGLDGKMSFVDVAIHETGHALGFVSGADGFSSYSFTALDLFRFQHTDGANNYHPDTYAEFQTTPRLVDYNTPDDDADTNLIDHYYRMSDGDPWQASHFREQTPTIGQMDPATSNGETLYPDYFIASDRNVFDAIGWDLEECQVAFFLHQPSVYEESCAGGTIQLDVTVNLANPVYQWRRSGLALVDDGVHILGATTDTLTLANVVAGDTAYYDCVVVNALGGCASWSNNASVKVYAPLSIGQQPADTTVETETTLNLTVGFSGTFGSAQWYKDDVPLTNGGRISGVHTIHLIVSSVIGADAGQYYCVLSNLCGDATSDPATVTVVAARCAGDTNCDGWVDFGDINSFVNAVLYGTYCDDGENADITADNPLHVGFEDVNPFVQLLTQNPLPMSCLP